MGLSEVPITEMGMEGHVALLQFYDQKRPGLRFANTCKLLVIDLAILLTLRWDSVSLFEEKLEQRMQVVRSPLTPTTHLNLRASRPDASRSPD